MPPAVARTWADRFNPAPMGLSQRGYARHRRCTLAAVQKALATGRITAGPDGLIDAATADRTWAARRPRE
jgi:hypothetical protein